LCIGKKLQLPSGKLTAREADYQRGPVGRGYGVITVGK